MLPHRPVEQDAEEVVGVGDVGPRLHERLDLDHGHGHGRYRGESYSRVFRLLRGKRREGPFASPGVRGACRGAEQIGATMKRSKTSSRDFRQAAALEASVGHSREHADEVRDLVSLGDFLAPEMHRTGGLDEAASAVREWVDDNVVMIEQAETIAEDQHRDYSAEILHRAKLLALVAH